ncbi:MAG: Crp/Fnr family transcriptional regulator [Myxococcota bacterium]|jgi:CRP-like cAMP-binding protein
MPSGTRLDAATTDALARADVFSALPQDALSAVVRLARQVTLKRGQALFLQGDAADAVYLVTRGRLKVTEESADGHSVVLRLEREGALLGLIAALDGGVYPVTVRALEACTVARWSDADWRALLDAHPRVALALLPMVLSRLRAIQDQYRELATERVEQRVARAVLRLARVGGRRTAEGVLVDAQVTRQELAEMAGTTLYTASRILSAWAARGLVSPRGRRLLIRAPHALVAIAEDLPGRIR